MKDIKHNVENIKQGFDECVQTAGLQLIKYYGSKKDIEDIRQEVPLYKDENGEPVGSSLGHLATYFIKLGFKTTIHTTDCLIFDRSWRGLKENQQIIQKLKSRRSYVKHPYYGEKELDLIFDGYINFLDSGGDIKFPVVTNEYLYSLLENGPIFTVVNYQFYNSEPKYQFSKVNNKNLEDDIKGRSTTHALILYGWEDGKYLASDSDPVYGGYREIDEDHFLGAFYLAQTDMDNLLITIE